eukprot:CAMPEP_0194346534 /NCGR_PEP_ID=MMETSP0171-20130528/105480_1 /TAXON_ID=218684 /ORGANISM="Corethron pennatum, Strain L29A3" /LENGTH=212 /DNA_ID=CAMNT_0039113669 /DNA_START=190 /DNA_END=828 /DNA_ORIENTATION=-
MKIVLKRAVAVLLANIVYVDGACAYPPDDKGATINYKGVDVIITPDANLTIPSNWTEIPAYAFRSCGDVKKVVIPAAITKILDNAFHGSEIEELSFEKNSQLETISGYAFVSSNIQSVRIPKSVTEILGYAFYNSLLLEQVLFEPGSRLETIGGYAFWGTKIQSVRIPKGITETKIQSVRILRFLVMHSIIHYFSSKCFLSLAASWKQLVVM